MHAPLDDAGDETFAHAHIEFARRKVVEKKQRFGALDDHIVDAHSHQIDPHGIVALHIDREAKFGADTVGSGHEHGLAIAIERHFDQGAESADAAQHFTSHRAPHMRFDSFYEFLAGVNIDSGLAIGYGRALSHSNPLVVVAHRRPDRPGRRGGSASCGILHQAPQGFRDNTMSQYFRVFSARYLRPAAILCLGSAGLCLADAAPALTRAELYQATVPVAESCEAAQPATFQSRAANSAGARHRPRLGGG